MLRRVILRPYRFLYPGMKTTLDIDDRLLIEAKAMASRERMTLTRLIEQGLELRLRRPREASRRKAPALPVHRGKGGLAQGVDPTSNRSLYDAAES